MKSDDEKERLMSRLSNLKNSEEKFRKISITDDYTVKEREEIRRWVEIKQN